MKYINTKLIPHNTMCARRNQIKKPKYKNSQTRQKKKKKKGSKVDFICRQEMISTVDCIVMR